MKITSRLPDPKVPYAYLELEFESLQEYKDTYTLAIKTILEVRKKTRETIKPE